VGEARGWYRKDGNTSSAENSRKECTVIDMVVRITSMGSPSIDRLCYVKCLGHSVNTLSKQSRTVDKRWSSSLGVGQRANNSSLSKRNSLL
jgi:hypothetical protein